MKKLYFLVVALCVFNGLNAQIVDIPDANFKAKLLAASSSNTIALDNLGNYIKIDTNNNGEIEVSETLNVSYLNISSSSISNLTGILSFNNLQTLDCSSNLIAILDVSGLVNLQKLICSTNKLTSLNVVNLTLDYLDCSHNLLADIDVYNVFNFNCSYNNLTTMNANFIQILNCSYNKFITLDLSKLKTFYRFSVNSCSDGSNALIQANFSNNPNLVTAILKNQSYQICGVPPPPGKTSAIFFPFNNNPNLKYLCVGESLVSIMKNQAILNGNIDCEVNSYCSFVPSGQYFIVQGTNKLDNNANGCDVLDINFPNLKFNITNGSVSGSFISNTTGNYSIPVLAGTHTITPAVENPTYFNVSPTNVTVDFPTQSSPQLQNFCITANGLHPDLEISLLPIRPAVPGFDAIYKIVYKNKGNQTQSGSVNLTFDDAVLDLVVANPATTTQTANNLSWDFTNLLPFETREIIFTLNVNSPMEIPAVNDGDILAYKATITSAANDETPLDNTFAYNQTVINSYDPNDKTCLEGTTISPDLIGQYVHYMIRFENNGTANAQNIVVKDMIDLSKFDISTLVPSNASHSFVTNISAGNKVEFIFENINLPFDDANNDGYIAFKIKTLPTLVVNDTFTNDASIYFDYNFPVLTKLASSTFKTLATQDFEFSNYFTLYPNPAKTVLNISSKDTIEVESISIYNTLGQLVLVIPNAEKVSKIDISSLTTGNYFFKINSDKGTSNTRFIKE